MFRPNQNYLTYFPNAELPISDYRSTRSSCLRAGAFIVMRKIIKDYKLEEILGMYFKDRDLGLFLDLAVYSIITEDNASQYYPDYAYNSPVVYTKYEDIQRFYSFLLFSCQSRKIRMPVF